MQKKTKTETLTLHKIDKAGNVVLVIKRSRESAMKILGERNHPQGIGPGTPNFILAEKPRVTRAVSTADTDNGEPVHIDDLPIEKAKLVIKGSLSEAFVKKCLESEKGTIREAAKKRLKELGGN